MSKLRWAQWFWADWANDTALNLCSIPARGLWMALLCIAAQGDPYGCVTIKGKPPTMAELRKLCGGPMRGNYARDFARWFAELERHKVFEWVEIEPVGASSTRPVRVMCASRMRRDGIIAMKRMRASHERWKLAEGRQSSLDLHMQKRGNGAGLHMQTDPFASTITKAEADSVVGGSPLKPRKKEPLQTSPPGGEASVISFSARKGASEDDA